MGLLQLLHKQQKQSEQTMDKHSVITWESGHVRAGVLKLEGGTAQIMGVAASPVHGIGQSIHPDPDRWLLGCERALNQAEEMSSQLSRRRIVPDHVAMTIPSEVTRTITVGVHSQRKRPQQSIGLGELQMLLRRGFRKAQDLLSNESRSHDIVSGSLSHSRLDGNLVVNPLGLEGRELSVQLSFCLAHMEWIRTLEEIAQQLQVELTALVPHHEAYAATLHTPRALLLVLTEEQTTVTMTRRGRVEWAGSVAHGAEDILSRTTDEFEISAHQRAAFLRLYRSGELDAEADRQVAQRFWLALQEWMAALATRIGQDSATFLPHQVFFCDRTRQVPEGLPALQTPYWEHQLPFERCPAAEELNTQHISNVLDCTTRATGPGYVLLRSMARYVARLYAPGNALEHTMLEYVRGITV